MIASSVLLAMYSPLLIGLPLRMLAKSSSCSVWYMWFCGAVVDATSVPDVDPQALRPLRKIGSALRAQHVGAHVVLAAGLLPAVADQPGPVGVLVDHREMIVDVAVLGAGEHLPAAHADRLDRVLLLHDPGADVEEVDVLLDVEVAGEPGEVVPVAHLVVMSVQPGCFGLAQRPLR